MPDYTQGEGVDTLDPEEFIHRAIMAGAISGMLASRRYVLAQVAYFATKNDGIFLDRRLDVAQKTGLSYRTVCSAFRDLVSRGYLQRFGSAFRVILEDYDTLYEQVEADWKADCERHNEPYVPSPYRGKRSNAE